MARDPGLNDPTKPPPPTFEQPSPERGIRNAMAEKEQPLWRSDDHYDAKTDPQGAKRQNDSAAREIEDRNNQWRKQKEKQVEAANDAVTSRNKAKHKAERDARASQPAKAEQKYNRALADGERQNKDYKQQKGREAMDARAEKGRESTKERLERLSQGQPARSMEDRRANLERLKQPKERQPRDRSKDQDRDR